MDRHPFKIGLIGLGTVGGAVFQNLTKHVDHYYKTCDRPVLITHVCARDKNKNRDFTIPDHVVWIDNPEDMPDQDIDCVIELMGGTSQTVENIFAKTMAQHKFLITANKAFLADNTNFLSDPYIAYEAAVAGGIPVIETLQSALIGNRIHKITAILNGTCNYILSRLETDNMDFEIIVQQAQDAGYAEADPTLDISGIDVLQKAQILSDIAFDTIPSHTLKGLDTNTPASVKNAMKNDQNLRLVAEITPTQITIDIKAYDQDHPFAQTKGADNAIMIEADPIGTLFLKGAGAGAGATASAVLANLCQFALR